MGHLLNPTLHVVAAQSVYAAWKLPVDSIKALNNSFIAIVTAMKKMDKKLGGLGVFSAPVDVKQWIDYNSTHPFFILLLLWFFFAFGRRLCLGGG